MASTLAAGRWTTGASSGRGMQYTIAVVQHPINICTPDTSEGSGPSHDRRPAGTLQPYGLARRAGGGPVAESAGRRARADGRGPGGGPPPPTPGAPGEP